MSVFVAGGSGTIGIPLVRALVAAGHQVTAMTRSTNKERLLGALGASVAIADALDRDAIARARSIFVFSIDGDAVSGIRVVRNPDKLAHIGRRLTIH